VKDVLIMKCRGRPKINMVKIVDVSLHLNKEDALFVKDGDDNKR